MVKKDYCTGFFERWPRWVKPWKWVIVEIGQTCCKDHDDEEDKRGGCDSHAFAKCLWKKKIVLGLPIFIIASVVCWVRHPKEMRKRL